MCAEAVKPVRHAVVLAHPDEDSFNAAVAAVYCDTVRESGQEVVLRDLYRLGFDPVLKKSERPGRPDFRMSDDVQAELDLLEGCNVFAFVYPIWFGMPPAMTKGYVDRVIGSGVTASQIQDRRGRGLLSGAHLFCITTSGAAEAWLDEQGQMDAQRELSSRYLFRAFAMKSAETMHMGGIVDGLRPRFVEHHLQEVRERTRRICDRLFAERHGSAPLAVWDGS